MSLIGSLEDLALGDILQILSLSRRSGILYLTKKDEEGKIVFADGQITSAASSAHPNNVLELLRDKGIIPDALLKETTEKYKAGGKPDIKKFLIQSGTARPEIIEEAVQSYITGTVFNFFSWTEGNFDFEIADTPDNFYVPGLEGYLDAPLNPQYVAIEGARKVDEEKRDTTVAQGNKSEFGPQIREMEELIIVDQKADSQTFLKDSLESRGFRAAAMADLNALYEYLEAIKDSPRFPMVVADLAIPKTRGEGMLGGMELLRWVSEKNMKIPVVLLSSINNEEAGNQKYSGSTHT
jgi:CheY-like chemotaxis protein